MNDVLHRRLAITVEVLSPLHIGTGAELLLNYDLVPRAPRTYRINEEAFLEQALVRAEAEGAAAVNRLLAGRPAGELLSEADFADPQNVLFRYVMPGTPSTKTPGAKIREQIKDVYDRLYLPGSSLKGALRTVLAWGMYARQKRRPDLARLGRSRSWAAQDLERSLFGRDPNHDLLRALHVEDSQPVAPAGHLALHTVLVYPTQTAENPGLPIDIEAIDRGTVFQAALSVDEYGLSDAIAVKLGWQGQRRWFDQLPSLAKEHARQRLLAEATYFKSHNGPVDTMRFYDGLIKTWSTLGANEWIVQLGWGTGWETKTLGSGLLRQNDQGFERMLDQYRMTKERDRRPGDPFPKTRHLVLDRVRHPAEPLGWVKVTLS